LNLPASFIRMIGNTFGERGRLFLMALPGLIEEAAQRWQLTDIHAVPNLSYNFVAFARRPDADVVLKLGVPDPELTSEIRSLRHFAGRCAARLLESDSGRGMLLLERLHPGRQLASFADDAEATRIAAEVMLAIRRPAPSEPGLIQLSSWLMGFSRMQDRSARGTGPLDRRLFDQAAAAARELLAEDHMPMLIHGDLHHFNILDSDRGWVAIDPKGVIGPAAYEVGPFLFNTWVVTGVPADAPRLMAGRLAILSEMLGLERERLRNWGLAHAVLSAIWSLQAREDWRPAMECARILAASQNGPARGGS
jgi:streptomycin 6-kinase